VYLGDEITSHKLELTWLRDRSEPYNLGDNEIHLAFYTDDYDNCYVGSSMDYKKILQRP